MSDVVLTHAEDGVLTITLNRPEARNAANRALAEGVADAVDRLESDDELRVAILTGAGGTFCSGMDLKAFVAGEMPVARGRGFAGFVEYLASKPIIAAVEGYALAGGFELAISCDLIVSAQDAKFGIPEVKRGLAAAAGGLVRLPRQIPPRIAMEMALTGDFISAERAYELGLVNRVVDAGGAVDAARALAATIAANGPLAVAASKKVIALAGDWTRDTMFKNQEAITQPVFTSEDAIEGATAFAEKRAPRWTGR
jgi:enoyl-CoA hydratase